MNNMLKYFIGKEGMCSGKDYIISKSKRWSRQDNN